MDLPIGSSFCKYKMYSTPYIIIIIIIIMANQGNDLHPKYTFPSTMDEFLFCCWVVSTYRCRYRCRYRRRYSVWTHHISIMMYTINSYYISLGLVCESLWVRPLLHIQSKSSISRPTPILGGSTTVTKKNMLQNDAFSRHIGLDFAPCLLLFQCCTCCEMSQKKIPCFGWAFGDPTHLSSLSSQQSLDILQQPH